MATVANTPTDYAGIAPAIRKAGYPVFPVARGNKVPGVKGFLSYEYDPQQNFRGYGAGICTGQSRDGCPPLVAIDIDIEDEARAQAVHDVVVARFGETIYRVGRAPRRLLVYRAQTAGWRKIKLDHMEILGDGQFFAAYGVHPVTKKPYTWPGALGGPLDVSAAQLPVVCEEGIAELVRYLGGEIAGSVAKEAGSPLDNYAPPLGKSVEELSQALAVLSPDDRPTWLQAGMALHHELEGSEEALALWDSWSSGSAKYKQGECEKIWNDMDSDPLKRRITARWLLHTANDVRSRQDKENAAAEYRLLAADIEACTDHNQLLSQLAPKIFCAAFAPATTSMLKTMLKNKHKQLTGYALADKDIPRANSTALALDEELTEIGNYYRMVKSYGSDIMYCAEVDRWYRWDGGRWVGCMKEIVLRLAEATVARIPKEADGKDGETSELIHKWYRASQKYTMQENMVKLAQKHDKVLTPITALDSDTDYIGMLNGSVYLPSGDLIAPRREQRITLSTGFEYDEEAQCPVFEQTVMDAFYDDAEMAGFLQRLVGYALLGRPEREEIMVIPEGHGANGKSTIFNAIHHALGDYSRFCSAETFIGQNSNSGSSPREDVLRLSGSRFVYVTELEDSGALRESVVKSMTGGEAIPARGLFSKNTVEVTPTWVVFMPTNHLPIIRSEDDGIWRKIIVLPFERSFIKDPNIVPDTRRKEKVRAEAAGILRWAVEGARMYLKDGLRIPQKVKDKNAAYRQNSDVLGEWIETSFAVDGGLFASNSELWSSWEAWSRANGKANLIKSANALSRRLSSRGFAAGVHPAKGRGFGGLGSKGFEDLL
jgi:P4 family phage/plasmid primase-like protien